MIFYTLFLILAFQFQQATALYDAYNFFHTTCLSINSTAVSFQQNPKIAIGCSDGIILIYSKDQLLLTLTGHTHTIIHLAWTMQYLISVDKSGLTLVRNISSYNILTSKVPVQNPKMVVSSSFQIAFSSQDRLVISTFKISNLAFSRTYISITGQFIGMIYSRNDGGNYLYTFDINHRYRYWVQSGECVPYTLNYTPIFIDSNPIIDEQVIITNTSDFEFMNSSVSTYKSYSSLGLKKIFYAGNGKQLFGMLDKTLLAYNQHAGDIQFQFQGWGCQLIHISSNNGLMVGSDTCGKFWIFIQKSNSLSILGIIIFAIFGILICAIIVLAARQQIKRKRMNRQQITWTIIFCCCRVITVMIVQAIRRKKTKHISFDHERQNRQYGLIA